jgi:hypothetical protein
MPFSLMCSGGIRATVKVFIDGRETAVQTKVTDYEESQTVGQACTPEPI